MGITALFIQHRRATYDLIAGSIVVCEPQTTVPQVRVAVPPPPQPPVPLLRSEVYKRDSIWEQLQVAPAPVVAAVAAPQQPVVQPAAAAPAERQQVRNVGTDDDSSDSDDELD